jgi:hypothetical protein
VCVCLISSRLLFFELAEDDARRKKDGEAGKDGAHIANLKKETPSILPWQDRGRVKIGIESNGASRFFKLKLTERARVPEFDGCTYF